MRAAQFRALLVKAGISQSELARQLKISDRTVRRYTSGESRLPYEVVHHVLKRIERQSQKSRMIR